MLTGPQQQEQPLAAFDPAAFRTGLTPRMGLTPGTGLTPLLGGPVSFPPASPNTAAFLSSVMNNNGTPSLSSVAGTITPNTLSAITGVLSSQHGPGAHVQSPLSMSAVTAGYPSRSDASSAAPNGASTNGNGYPGQQTAPNGLFLLSQAHQELTKREEEQAAAAAAQMNGSPTTTTTTTTNGTANGHTNGNAKRGTKRKSYESESPVSATAPVPPQSVHQQQQTQQPQNGGPKRTRSQTMSSNGRRASTVSLGDEEEEDDDDDGMMGGGSSTSSGGQQTNGKKNGQPKKPETEEEKRRNFLERNRQGKLVVAYWTLCPKLIALRTCAYSRTQVPTTQKGVARPAPGESRVPAERERDAEAGARCLPRGDRAADVHGGPGGGVERADERAERAANADRPRHQQCQRLPRGERKGSARHGRRRRAVWVLTLSGEACSRVLPPLLPLFVCPCRGDIAGRCGLEVQWIRGVPVEGGGREFMR